MQLFKHWFYRLTTFILLTPLPYPDQKLEGVDSVIHGPLDVIHQVIGGASDHYCGDGAIFLICRGEHANLNVTTKRISHNSLKNKYIKITVFENHHLRVSNFSQIHAVTMTHLFWGWCHLKTERDLLNIQPTFHGSNTNGQLKTLTILGRATAWTVLHNLLRSHLEFSLMMRTIMPQVNILRIILMFLYGNEKPQNLPG